MHRYRLPRRRNLYLALGFGDPEGSWACRHTEHRRRIGPLSDLLDPVAVGVCAGSRQGTHGEALLLGLRLEESGVAGKRTVAASPACGCTDRDLEPFSSSAADQWFKSERVSG